MSLSILEVLMNAQINLQTFQQMNPAVARHPIFMIAKQQLDNGIQALSVIDVLQAALAQPAAPSARGRMHSCDIPECVACGNPPYLEYEQEGRDE